LGCYRLVNGAGDGLPGLAVDRFEGVLVVHADTLAEADAVAPMLGELVQPQAVYTKARPRQASRLDEAERAASAPSRPAWGEPVEKLVVREWGARYQVRPGGGLSVGLFLDMREVRRWVGASSAGLEVLNLFAYTCAFGVSACLGGARRVLNLDAARGYLAWGRENYALNGLAVDERDFVFGDAFDWLGRLARRGQRFDLVIADPPSFGSTRAGAFSAARQYDRLVAAAAPVVAAGGTLLAATNHAGLPARRFGALVDRGLEVAGRRGRRRRRWHEPDLDFPRPPGQPPYLKIQALQLD
jgi:23S rRNA (cytosine1962-C5)-methyltransferase